MPYNFLLNCVPGNGLLLEGADVEYLAEPALADVVGVVLVEELPLVVDGREAGAARLVLEAEPVAALVVGDGRRRDGLLRPAELAPVVGDRPVAHVHL